jgi:hypothetical protein
MRIIILFCAFFLSAASAFGQFIPRQSFEDRMLGWMKVYHFKGAKEPMKVDHRLYSVAQLSICDSFTNWIQASYIPKGGLGDVKRVASEKIGLYNKNTAALPQSYGASALTYYYLKYNAQRKFVLETNHHVEFAVIANNVPGWEIRDISTPTQYYFTMPSYSESNDGEKMKKQYDLSNSPNLKPYINFWVKSIETGGGTTYVLLSRNNRSPFIQLTKGEYLQLLEAALPGFFEQERKKVDQQFGSHKGAHNEALKYLEAKKDRFYTGLKNNKNKYKDRLAEPALTNAQPTLYDLEFRDVFSNGAVTDPESTVGRVPVYKVDPAMAELCKKDKPQWILISWWWSPNDPLEKHMHESIINNFNFDYVYKFFFDPEKVKGVAYKPLRTPLFKETVVATQASAASQKNTTDKNIHFFEDFSTTGIGQKPIGWQAKLSLDGSTAIVTKVDGLEGNWAATRGHYLSATKIKKPMPQDFTLSYEVVAAQNFTWGAKGLTLQLAKETSPGNAESFLMLRVRPGFDGRDGEVVLETKFPYPPGYSNTTKWLVATGFSNNKKNNRITVTIKKKEEMLQVFIDKTKIAEYEKAIPAAHLFNALSFDCNGNSAENDKYYISAIKITKD